MPQHGVIASIQPQFVPSDAAWLASKLPQQLMRLAYPWKSLLQTGTGIINDSLYSVAAPNKLDVTVVVQFNLTL